jgi:S1-C subfamily serine protease
VTTSASGDARQNPRYIAGLALAAAAILVVGFLLKPRKPQSEAQPTLSQTEMQRLARLAQRRSLDTMTDHFAAVVADLASRVVQVGAGTGSGILWESDLVVTAGGGVPAPESTVVMTPAGHLLTATRLVAGPQLPLVAYQFPGETRPPRTGMMNTDVLEPAEWVLAVWHQEGDLGFCPGHYTETRRTRCGELMVEEVRTSLDLSSEMAGGGLFDLDGALMAVILPCGGGYAALSPSSVSRLIRLGRSLEGRILAHHGMRTAPLTEAVRRHFGLQEGALVTEVWKGRPAARAGLRPGDVIVGLGEHPVATPRDLEPLLLPAELGASVLRVRRGQRTVEIDLPPGSVSTARPEGDAHGVLLDSTAPGFVVGSVSSGSPAEEAGLRPGDRILRVDDRQPRSAAELRRLLERSRSMFVELERGGRQLGLLLE